VRPAQVRACRAGVAQVGIALLQAAVPSRLDIGEAVSDAEERGWVRGSGIGLS
jgi:hypothetical protein